MELQRVGHDWVTFTFTFRAITPAAEAVCVPEHLALPGPLKAKQPRHLHTQLSAELPWLAQWRPPSWGSGGGLLLLSARRVIERWMHSCVWAEAPPTLCRPRPGKCPTGLACLISNSWAAFVAWPNFCILCAYTETLNYLSSLPFNKFILECFDWRKLQMKLKLQIRKLHSEVQILRFWLNMGKVG